MRLAIATPCVRPSNRPAVASRAAAQRGERVDDRRLCRLLRCDRLDLPALDLDQHRVERGVVVEVVALGCELDRSVEGLQVGAGNQVVQLDPGVLGQRQRLTQLFRPRPATSSSRRVKFSGDRGPEFAALPGLGREAAQSRRRGGHTPGCIVKGVGNPASPG